MGFQLLLNMINIRNEVLKNLIISRITDFTGHSEKTFL